MSIGEDDFMEELRRLRTAVVRDEVLRVRIAAWGLLAIAIGVFAYLLFLVFHPKAVQPQWEFVALLAFAGFCVAVPLIAKLNFSKDGGGLDFASPIDLIDRLEAKARAARTESFEQTRQQISALSLQVQELSDTLNNRREAGAGGERAEGGVGGEVTSEPTLRQIRSLLPPVTDPKDQQKNRFDGAEANGSRRLSAKVLPSGFGKDWVKVVLKLSSTDERPLEGAFAYFFLHETFDPDVYRVKVVPGAKDVSFEIAAAGAFTAGVLAERGATRLEIDLATSPNVSAPRDWRDR